MNPIGFHHVSSYSRLKREKYTNHLPITAFLLTMKFSVCTSAVDNLILNWWMCSIYLISSIDKSSRIIGAFEHRNILHVKYGIEGGGGGRAVKVKNE